MSKDRSVRRIIALAAIGCALIALAVFGQPAIEGSSVVHHAFGPPESSDAGVRRPASFASASARAAVLTPMRYSIGPTRRVDGRLAGAQSWEPSVVVTQAGTESADDDQVTVIWMEGRRLGDLSDTRIGMAMTFDGGEGWMTSELVTPAAPTGTMFDPMTAVDAATGRAYVGAMSRDLAVGVVDSVWISGKDASAAAFEAPYPIFADDGIDKGWMAAGPLPAPLGGSALYVTFNGGVQGTIGLRSRDGGATFESFAIPGGVGYQPRVDPEGTVTISFSTRSIGSAGATLVRSRDALESISAPLIHVPFIADRAELNAAVPGDFRVPDLAMHAVDPLSGRLYLVYNDVTEVVGGEADVNLVLRDSVDGGANWSEPRIVNGDGAPAGDQFMPWIECDAEGRLHLAYFDNRRNATPDASGIALLDVYYAMSTDGGSTWEEARLTSAALDGQSTWWNPLGYGTRFVGDYIGLAVSRHAAYVAYPGDDAGEVAMMVTRIDLSGSPAGVRRTRPFPAEMIQSRVRRDAPLP